MEEFVGSALLVDGLVRLISLVIGSESGQVGDQKATISLVDLKNLCRGLLRSNDVLFELIMSEPNELSREAALAKMEIFVRLLYGSVRYRDSR